MDNIDHVFYINLENRKDRRENIEKYLDSLSMKYERFEAIPTPGFGILGCTKSHNEVVKLAKKRGYKNVLILEDDAAPLLSRGDMDRYLSMFFSQDLEYNMLFLSYALQEHERVSDNLIRIRKSSSAAAYVVNSNYYDEMINLWSDAAIKLEETRMHWLYANDAVWFPLQKIHIWYGIAPIFFVQETGYSDNSLSMQDYSANYLAHTKKNYMKKIFIYGDSHARASFFGPSLSFSDMHQPSITMHRIGRDGAVPNLSYHHHDENSILLFCFGEVDCRCHIMRQINSGRELREIVDSLVIPYIESIRKGICKFNQVVIIGIIPPTRQADYEARNGPIKHEFPFLGTDRERVKFTSLMNDRLEEESKKLEKFSYLYPYANYENHDGTFKYSRSDNCVHLGDNSECVDELKRFVYGKIDEAI